MLPLRGPSRRRTGLPAASPLKAQEFLGLLPTLVREELPDALRDFSVRGPLFSLVGFYYAQDPRIHYEIWLQRAAKRVEIGLHFEAAADVNARWFAYLGGHAPEVLAELGPGVEAEQWTRSWTRLHENSPLEPLTHQFAHDLAARMAAFIRVLEPILREAAPDLAAKSPDP